MGFLNRALALACCLEESLREVDLLVGLVEGMKGKHLLKRASFEAAEEAGPAVEAIAAAADTAKTVEQVGLVLLESVLAGEARGTCLVVVVFDTVGQEVNTDSGEAGPQLGD